MSRGHHLMFIKILPISISTFAKAGFWTASEFESKTWLSSVELFTIKGHSVCILVVWQPTGFGQFLCRSQAKICYQTQPQHLTTHQRSSSPFVFPAPCSQVLHGTWVVWTVALYDTNDFLLWMLQSWSIDWLWSLQAEKVKCNPDLLLLQLILTNTDEALLVHVKK